MHSASVILLARCCPSFVCPLPSRQHRECVKPPAVTIGPNRIGPRMQNGSGAIPAAAALPLPRDLDSHILTLLNKISQIKEQQQQQQQSHSHHHHHHHHRRRNSMSIEVWSLELWRAVAVECFATFLFAFIIVAATMTTLHTQHYPNYAAPGLSIVSTALASGMAIGAIQLIFGPLSGKSSQ